MKREKCKKLFIIFFIVCSSYITYPDLKETSHLNKFSRIRCTEDENWISFDHSITLTGIRVFFEYEVQRPNLEFECHLNNHVSTVKVCIFYDFVFIVIKLKPTTGKLLFNCSTGWYNFTIKFNNILAKRISNLWCYHHEINMSFFCHDRL